MGIADGKRALIIGVANDKSLAWSISQELRAQGAEIALTYQGEVLEKRVRPLAEQIGARVVGELDVTSDPQIDSTLSTLRQWWGGLDMLVHAVAFAEREDLRDRFLNVNRTNFARALYPITMLWAWQRPPWKPACATLHSTSARRIFASTR